MTALTHVRFGAFLLAAALLGSAGEALAQDGVPTRVFLNGVPTPVYFNDGDSFRVLGGRHYGSKARLSGFNTLESYGSVHQWGQWKAKELYYLAKLATSNARQGVWHCTSDLERDTYGRILWWCPDLAVDQVRRGYAHAMTVTLEAGDPRVVAAQQAAIRERRGMWAHGVPEYVLTSLHSTSEGGGYDGKTYNRLVSSRDGHSAKWHHDTAYDECARICSEEREVGDADVEAGLEALRANPEVTGIVAKLTEPELRNVVGDYLRLQRVFWPKDESKQATLRKALEGIASDLSLPALGEGSCVIYVDFERRFGAGRAACLD